MKTNSLLLLTICFCSIFISCDDQTQNDVSDAYYAMLKEQINAEYDSLPDLKPILNWSEVESYSHFSVKNNRIIYNGATVFDSRDLKPLYAQDDVLILLSGEMLIVLYKTEIAFDPMKYNTPTILNGKIKGNLAYVKLQDAKNGKIILIKYVSEVGKEPRIYVCNY